jgi:hypothetical protein
MTKREKTIVTYLLAGRTVSYVAVAIKVSRPAMKQCKDRLATLIQEFFGMNILIEVLRLPGWRNDSTRRRRGWHVGISGGTVLQKAGVRVNPGSINERTDHGESSVDHRIDHFGRAVASRRSRTSGCFFLGVRSAFWIRIVALRSGGVRMHE